ncbi:MAG: bifunctional oligoribonuclease/PAP phosphatase NrnA [Nitrospirota bacterium]|jgi:phosphoesterase RecJ-like protein
MNGRDAMARFLMEQHHLLLACHVSPDGDTLGSALALAEGLRGMGKEAVVMSTDRIPEPYDFLPGQEKVTDTVPEGFERKAAVVLLDCNRPDRAGLTGRTFARSAVIDHHETGSDFGDVTWVESSYAATALMVLELLKALGIALTPAMATNLYTGLAVDTGTFRYANTTPLALRAAAALVEAGANAGSVANNLYRNWTPNKFDLLCLNLSTMEVADGVGVSAISQEMFEKTGTTALDTESFVNFPLLIKGIGVSILMREVQKDTWKVSLRSKGRVNVARVAQEFGGGGHENAAGCTLNGGREEIRERLTEAVKARTAAKT